MKMNTNKKHITANVGVRTGVTSYNQLSSQPPFIEHLDFIKAGCPGVYTSSILQGGTSAKSIKLTHMLLGPNQSNSHNNLIYVSIPSASFVRNCNLKAICLVVDWLTRTIAGTIA